MSIKQFWRLLKQSFQEWQRDRASLLAAALAYYTALSIAPVLVLVIAIAGFFLGQEAARGEVFAQLQGLMGDQGAEAVQSMLENANDRSSGLIATVISLGLLIFSASGVFNHLRESLNLIWNVSHANQGGVKQVLKQRILSFSMIPVIGFLLMVSLGLSAVLSSLSGWVLGPLQDWLPILRIINFAVSFGVITLLFALIYKVLPDAEVSWGDVWIGAAATALLFTIGKWGIGLYLGNSSTASAYGAAGSFVVLLLWIYYSAQILFFGAEFTQVYANRYGSRIRANSIKETLAVESNHTQGGSKSWRDRVT